MSKPHPCCETLSSPPSWLVLQYHLDCWLFSPTPSYCVALQRMPSRKVKGMQRLVWCTVGCMLCSKRRGSKQQKRKFNSQTLKLWIRCKKMSSAETLHLSCCKYCSTKLQLQLSATIGHIKPTGAGWQSSFMFRTPRIIVHVTWSLKCVILKLRFRISCFERICLRVFWVQCYGLKNRSCWNSVWIVC